VIHTSASFLDCAKCGSKLKRAVFPLQVDPRFSMEQIEEGLPDGLPAPAAEDAGVFGDLAGEEDAIELADLLAAGDEGGVDALAGGEGLGGDEEAVGAEFFLGRGFIGCQGGPFFGRHLPGGLRGLTICDPYLSSTGRGRPLI